MSKKTFKVVERGHFENGDNRQAIYDGGQFRGHKTYPEAVDYVLEHGGDGDTYIEEYQGNNKPTVTTVGDLREERQKTKRLLGLF